MSNSVLNFLGRLFHFGECSETRKLLKNNKLQGLFLLSVYQEQKKGKRRKVEAISSGDKARKHVLECKSCEKWLHKIIPEDVVMQQKHQSKYCCTKLFKAVEEAKPGAVEQRVLSKMNHGLNPQRAALLPR